MKAVSVALPVLSVLVHLFLSVDSDDAWTAHRNDDHKHGAPAPEHAWCASAGAGARWRDGALAVTDDWLSSYRHREDVRTETLAAGDPARRANGLPERPVEQPGVLPVGRAAP